MKKNIIICAVFLFLGNIYAASLATSLEENFVLPIRTQAIETEILAKVSANRKALIEPQRTKLFGIVGVENYGQGLTYLASANEIDFDDMFSTIQSYDFLSSPKATQSNHLNFIKVLYLGLFCKFPKNERDNASHCLSCTVNILLYQPDTFKNTNVFTALIGLSKEKIEQFFIDQKKLAAVCQMNYTQAQQVEILINKLQQVM